MNAFFKLITAEQAQQQGQQFAQQSRQAFEEESAAKARSELLRRPVGRPKRDRSVNDALSAAATAASAASSQQQEDNVEEEQTTKKAKRMHWFDSPLIHDILHAYKLSGFSSRKCVEHLQRKHTALPTETEGRFDKLTESTVRSWFDDDHKLKPQFQQLLRGGEYRAGGHESVLSAYPVAEQRIKQLLQQLRDDKNAVVSLYNVHDKDEQKKATRQAIEKEIDASDAVPVQLDNSDQDPPAEDQEQDAEYCEEESEDEDKTEKQVMKERVFGERKSIRDRKQAQPYGYQLSTSQLKFS
jgi:hypothetical protein